MFSLSGLRLRQRDGKHENCQTEEKEYFAHNVSKCNLPKNGFCTPIPDLFHNRCKFIQKSRAISNTCATFLNNYQKSERYPCRLTLRRHPVCFALQFTERAQVGFGGCHDDVGIGPDAVDDAPTVLQTHCHLALAFGGATDGID